LPEGDGGVHRELSMAMIAFHDAVARRLGMSAAETKCLGVLARMGEATPGQLAQATGLTTGAITGVVDRLEKAGYAERAPNPKDRRSLIVRPLRQEELGRTVGPLYRSLGEAMIALTAQYTPDQMALILGYLAQTIDVLKTQTAKVEAGA
jgi:DNA-binding MarR family transcriptional regulator